MTESNLNDMAEKLDSDGMLDSLRCFVDDLIRAFTQFDFEVPKWIDEVGSKEWDGILCLGMGGSGAIGDVISAILSREDIHVSNVKGYLLPKTVDERTLVISTSISGNTKETLSILDYKTKSKAKFVAISSGGMMKEKCMMNMER